MKISSQIVPKENILNNRKEYIKRIVFSTTKSFRKALIQSWDEKCYLKFLEQKYVVSYF